LSKPALSPSSSAPLTSLQAAALGFTDASTTDVKVPSSIFDALKTELKSLVNGTNGGATVEELLVEAAALVATYNLVSRFLASVDVGGKMNDVVPWPVDRQEVRSVTPS
jgi:hypothetical protein